ncbi:hypothetical protein O4273_23935 [Rhodococcus ruber]|uniref:hypothetical protein n=1 Tax=Rhodococcus ruber TaxID=1830 RepID=UPI0022B5C994|nr:hypothetical protein [Rhodococcus ruber]MCZ4505884.1 hypothetical protein [Rhodococcus ruber]
MTVGELIEKLSKLSPSAVVVCDDEIGFDAELTVYKFKARVKRNDGWESVFEYCLDDTAEDVALISRYGHDDKEEL